jgi:hypothetical protein
MGRSVTNPTRLPQKRDSPMAQFKCNTLRTRIVSVIGMLRQEPRFYEGGAFPRHRLAFFLSLLGSVVPTSQSMRTLSSK